MIIVTLELTYQMRAEKHILALASVSVAFVKGLVKIDNVAVFSFSINSSIYNRLLEWSSFEKYVKSITFVIQW